MAEWLENQGPVTLADWSHSHWLSYWRIKDQSHRLTGVTHTGWVAGGPRTNHTGWLESLTLAEWLEDQGPVTLADWSHSHWPSDWRDFYVSKRKLLMIINMVPALSEASSSKQISCHKLMIQYPSSFTEKRPTWFIITAWPVSAYLQFHWCAGGTGTLTWPMTELVLLSKVKGIKRIIIKMLHLSQVNILFVPCPFKSFSKTFNQPQCLGPSINTRTDTKPYNNLLIAPACICTLCSGAVWNIWH